MTIRTKLSAIDLSNEFKNAVGYGYPSSCPTIYFFDKLQKRYNYIIKVDAKVISLSFDALKDNTNVEKEIENLENFIWINRKYINASSRGIEIFNFPDVYHKFKAAQ